MSGRTEGGVKERGFYGLAVTIFVVIAMALGVSTPSRAAPIDDQFQAWLQNDLWPEAQAKGISKKTFDAAFIGVKPNLKLPDLVMPGKKPTTPEKQHQAEFGPPANYFAEKIIRPVTAGGRSRESTNARVLGLIEKRYGVPGEIVLAIWGRETGFGAARMPYDAFEVLGTKAFMSTKKDFFRTEVLAAPKP
ncbi:MAG: lytic murein transglycosylase, partial [Mesorhizobium sp.]|uniref:lytic murein transglycosylase n=1 Tax=Mesorhizobium sp. TaxID=1871066 RepID=UPI000FE7AC0F